jgi:murein DD-endopeptidase MepM/ murein hydrolase activator NlpD
MNKKITRRSLRFVVALCAAATLASGAVYAAESSATAATQTTADNFTDVIVTSFDEQELHPSEVVKINALVNKNDTIIMAISDKVVYLANQDNTPCGWPVDSRIVTTEFNPTGNHSISDGRKHEGIDISTRSQIIPIYATANGKVVTANYDSGYGYQIIIDHGNGYTTLYAHCNELLVNAGDAVKKGDIIATTGDTGWSTGIHCHYEIMLDGEYQNPRNFL